jgi:hypothetical protein
VGIWRFGTGQASSTNAHDKDLTCDHGKKDFLRSTSKLHISAYARKKTWVWGIRLLWKEHRWQQIPAVKEVRAADTHLLELIRLIWTSGKEDDLITNDAERVTTKCHQGPNGKLQNQGDSETSQYNQSLPDRIASSVLLNSGGPMLNELDSKCKISELFG